MAIEDQTAEPTGESPDTDGPVEGSPVRVGEYTWADFMAEFGHEDEIEELYPHGPDATEDQLGLDTGRAVPGGDDWEAVDFDPAAYLRHDPDELQALLREVFVPNARVLYDRYEVYATPETTPAIKDLYTWEHFEVQVGSRDREATLGFDPDKVPNFLNHGGEAAMVLDDIIEDRTVNVSTDIDEDAFFTSADGHTTVTNRYDLEKAVPLERKRHFVERERYWVNKPYAFVVIFHSEKENEKKYYMIEPHLNGIEEDLQGFLSSKLRTAIKYSDEDVKGATEEGRREVIERETRRLLTRYDLFERTSGPGKLGVMEIARKLLEDEETDRDVDSDGHLDGIEARPEPVVLEEDADTLTEYQVEKLLYLLKRNFIGYERIDGIKHDINVEDISCDGYNSPVFVYHSEYEQIISNIHHGKEELDDFVVKLAQRSGKGISKRLPQVDATLPDGSRAQLTLGAEVSDHGTNYTIRQFKDVPFTPIDLINWNTFSLDEMAFLWLAIENNKSLIFAGGTASGKTTSLNAVSLFIPSSAKIVSIEDTREVELPQRNWIASVTRPSFSDDSTGDIDEFDLLEAALRQRPDYIVMGEIRGEEGRTLFQVMSTGHTTYTTFHADSVDEVLKRFTTDPINVSKTMFTALDLVSIQTQTRVQGRKVRRNKSLTEINHYEAENDEINVQDVYQWQAETDEYLKMGDSNTLEEIKFDRGWQDEKLQEELFKRQVILAYLIKNGLNTYAEVAATVQAFINDPDTILTLIANERLEDSLADLREMESVLIDVDPEKEALVPRPEATKETENLSMDLLERAEESLFEQYRGELASDLGSALGQIQPADEVEADEAGEAPEPVSFGTDADEGDAWDFSGDDSEEFSFESEGELASAPDWTDESDGGTAADDEAGPGTVEFGPEQETAPGGEGPESDDIDGLFGDMDEAIEDLEDASGASADAEAADDEIDDLFGDAEGDEADGSFVGEESGDPLGEADAAGESSLLEGDASDSESIFGGSSEATAADEEDEE